MTKPKPQSRDGDPRHAKKANETSFKPGQSGNPGGRPVIAKSLQELARTYTEEAVKALVEALKNPRHCVYAATALLDRGYGRPIQTQSIRVIRAIEDLSDAELAALAGTAPTEEEQRDTTRH